MGGKIEVKSKVITAISSHRLREVLNIARAENIQKEDIVSFINEGGQYVMIYYK